MLREAHLLVIFGLFLGGKLLGYFPPDRPRQDLIILREELTQGAKVPPKTFFLKNPEFLDPMMGVDLQIFLLIFPMADRILLPLLLHLVSLLANSIFILLLSCPHCVVLFKEGPRGRLSKPPFPEPPNVVWIKGGEGEVGRS